MNREAMKAARIICLNHVPEGLNYLIVEDIAYLIEQAIKAERERILNALQPFAEAASDYKDEAPDKAAARYPHGITIGQYRKAAEVFKQIKSDQAR